MNVALERNTLLQLIDTAESANFCPQGLRNIMYKELEQYFSGVITEDMLIKHLESRVGLYLNERN